MNQRSLFRIVFFITFVNQMFDCCCFLKSSIVLDVLDAWNEILRDACISVASVSIVLFYRNFSARLIIIIIILRWRGVTVFQLVSV